MIILLLRISLVNISLISLSANWLFLPQHLLFDSVICIPVESVQLLKFLCGKLYKMCLTWNDKDYIIKLILKFKFVIIFFLNYSYQASAKQIFRGKDLFKVLWKLDIGILQKFKLLPLIRSDDPFLPGIAVMWIASYPSNFVPRGRFPLKNKRFT